MNSSSGFCATHGWFSPSKGCRLCEFKENAQIKVDCAPIEQGKKFDAGKPRLELLSRTALEKIAAVMAHGAKKYNEDNWKKGLEWRRVLGAALRHLNAYSDGEDKDAETGLSHLAHCSCCLMFLLEYEETHRELDNRYKK